MMDLNNIKSLYELGLLYNQPFMTVWNTEYEAGNKLPKSISFFKTKPSAMSQDIVLTQTFFQEIHCLNAD